VISSVLFFAVALFVFYVWGWPNLKLAVPLLFARKRRCAFEAGPQRLDKREWPEAFRPLIDELASLDFQPLGVKVESRPFRVARELAFASPEKRTFASIHGLERGVPNYYFYTPYDDGSVVLTSNHAMETVRTDRFLQTGMPHQEMSQVLASHTKNVEKMTGPKRQPIAQYDQEARIRATHAYYDNPGSEVLIQSAASGALRNAGISLLFLVTALAVLVWRWLPVVLALKLF
jgi:hypothetical protein